MPRSRYSRGARKPTTKETTTAKPKTTTKMASRVSRGRSTVKPAPKPAAKAVNKPAAKTRIGNINMGGGSAKVEKTKAILTKKPAGVEVGYKPKTKTSGKALPTLSKTKKPAGVEVGDKSKFRTRPKREQMMPFGKRGPGGMRRGPGRTGRRPGGEMKPGGGAKPELTQKLSLGNYKNKSGATRKSTPVTGYQLNSSSGAQKASPNARKPRTLRKRTLAERRR